MLPRCSAKAAPTGGTAYNNDHPVGDNAIVGCNAGAARSGYNWDCTGGGANTHRDYMPAPCQQDLPDQLSRFLLESGEQPPGIFGGTTVNAVTCTTCHDQHSMTVYKTQRVLSDDVLH